MTTNTVRQGIGFFEIVRGQHHSFSALQQVANFLPKQVSRFEVQSHGRLVEKKKVGVATNRQGEEYPLLLPA